jgi:hypothetical protein
MSSLQNLDDISASLVLNYLTIKDSIKICYTNKTCYKRFLIFCYQYSFVSLNFTKTYHGKLRPNRFNGDDKEYHQIVTQYINSMTNIPHFKRISYYPTKYLRIIHFDKSFNTPWPRNIFPPSVEVLMFHQKSKFNFNLSRGNLPPNLKQIYFGKYFNKKIDNLPDSLEFIYFYKSSYFNQLVKTYPTNLREIYYGETFTTYSSLLTLPNGVKKIHFANLSRFNTYIERYPTELEEIHFGIDYNHILTPLTTSKLKVLRFYTKAKFNQEFKIPSLEIVVFGKYFNQPLDLTNIRIVRFYSKSIFDNTIQDNTDQNDNRTLHIQFGKYYLSKTLALPSP